jgi:hypothetical protein
MNKKVLWGLGIGLLGALLVKDGIKKDKKPKNKDKKPSKSITEESMDRSLKYSESVTSDKKVNHNNNHKKDNSYNNYPKDNRDNKSIRASGKVGKVYMGTANNPIANVSIYCTSEQCGKKTIESKDIEIKNWDQNFKCCVCNQKYHLKVATLRGAKEGDEF